MSAKKWRAVLSLEKSLLEKDFMPSCSDSPDRSSRENSQLDGSDSNVVDVFGGVQDDYEMDDNLQRNYRYFN